MLKGGKLNIVDGNDHIIGQETREKIHQKGLLHREIHLWIYNQKGEILLQERSMAKKTYPGLLDASVNGHVEINETYQETALRELKEEAGLKASEKELIYLTEIRTKTTDQGTETINNVIRKIYAYRYDDQQEIKLEKGEAKSLTFWPLEKIFNLSSKDKKKFVPVLLKKPYLEIFRKIQQLI